MADDINVKDASGATVTVRAKGISSKATQIFQKDIGGPGVELLECDANPGPVYYPSGLFGAGNPGSVEVQTGYLEVTGTGAASGSPTIIAALDALAYSEISIQIVTNSSTDTLAWQISNDNVHFQGFCLPKTTDTSAALVLNSGGGGTGIWQGKLPGRYFQLVRTGTASTVAVTAELRQ